MSLKNLNQNQLMKERIIKLEIINSANDDKKVEWFFCNTSEEKHNWIREKRIEEDKWNYHTPGANSIRYYSFTEYLISNLLEEDISELKGLTLRDFVEIIKNLIFDEKIKNKNDNQKDN